MTPLLTSDLIELDLTAAVGVRISHGLGRQIKGWLVIWSTAPLTLSVLDPDADTKTELVLVPDATCRARVLLL